MLFIEERQKLILNMVQEFGRVTVQELVQALDISESTIRRDLNEMDKNNLLTKVHGGAIANTQRVTKDVKVAVRTDINRSQKEEIARYAASLIEEDDVVFLDAGTTTGYMIPYIEATSALFITNAITHAKQLSDKGIQVYLPGGILKNDTEALIGHHACEFLQSFHFNNAFLGTNGITRSQGFTTPDVREGNVKATACRQAAHCYILGDSSKFGAVSTFTFCKYADAKILTDTGVPDQYKHTENCTVVSAI